MSSAGMSGMRAGEAHDDLTAVALAGASLAMLNILLIPHTLGRALLVGTSTAPPA